MKKITFITLIVMLSLIVSCATSETQNELSPNTGSIDVQLIFPDSDSGPDSISNPLTCPTCKCPTCTRIDFRVTGPGMSQMDFRQIDYSLLAFTLTNIPLGANRLVECWVYDTENPLSEAAAIYQGSFLVASLAANTPSSAPIVLETEAGDWFVDGGVTASGSGKSWAVAFKTIQEAVDIAQAGDNIFVKEGTYTHDDIVPMIVMRDGIDIYGGFHGTIDDDVASDANPTLYPTILDGNHKVETIVVGSSNARIDGFAITNSHGDAMLIDGKVGLAINNCVFHANDNRPMSVKNFSRITIDNSEFIDNGSSIEMKDLSYIRITGSILDGNTTSSYGGAIYALRVSLEIIDSTFINNSTTSFADSEGGAIYLGYSNLQMNNCDFIGNNTLCNGAGIYAIYSSGSVVNSRFSENISSPNSGGAVAIDTSDMVFDNCNFSFNRAGNYGGAIQNSNYTTGYSITISNSKFNGNYALKGGAIDFGENIDALITNCLFKSNGASTDGGALCLHSNSGIAINETIRNCTFYANSAYNHGGGICNMDHILNITDSILWNNVSSTGPDQIWSTGTTSVNYSDYQLGFFGGTGNINSDPLFINAPPGLNVDLVISASTTTSVGTSGLLTYNIGDMIEIGDDDIARTVVSYANPLLTFSPALQAIPAAGTTITNWGSALTVTEDFHLSQTAAGQGSNSPCVDAGSAQAATLGMDVYTTRTDNIADSGTVDMGYHYPIP